MSDQQLATKIESRIDKSVSANTGLTQTGAMAFASVEQIMEFAKVMAIAGVAVPKHLRENVGACLAVAIQASEWQMSPFAVASKTYVVNDRIAFEAQLVNAVILKRAPIKGRFKISYSGDGQGRRCKVSATLTDGDEVDYESPTLATIPVKNSPLWKGDPDQQLFYYSSRAMCRRHFPDVLLGIYTPDEMADAIDVDAQVTKSIQTGKIGAEKTTPPVESFPEKTSPPAEKTITEQAAEEQKAAKTEEPQKTEPPPAKGPSADSLRKVLIAKGNEIGIGKVRILSVAVELKLAPEGSKWDELDAKTLANIDDSWEHVIEAVKPPTE